MEFYFAPLEGITGYCYRNAYHHYFYPAERYYTPFIAPDQNLGFSAKEKKDLIPEHNQNIPIVPQILTNRARPFLHTAQMLADWGYDEVNLNLGCPSRTVVTKKKGSGLLGVLDELEDFLDAIFQDCPLPISIKTRAGVEEAEEFYEILDLYNEYPVKELILHPRVQKDMYNNKPNLEIFRWALDHAKAPVVYNGDLFTKEDYETFHTLFPQVDKVMIGRGILENPNLLGEIQAQQRLEKETLKKFHDEILTSYIEIFSGDRPVLFKMKEIWGYMLPLFRDGKEYQKKIRKAEKIPAYQRAVESLFETDLL